MSGPMPATGRAPGELDDVQRLWQLVLFCFGALGRHRRLFALVATFTFVLVIAALMVMKSTYRVETRILTQESYLITALVSQSRSGSLKAPGTRHAVELINSRENLSGIISEANLIDRWPETRGTVRSLKDDIFAAVFGEMSREDLHEVILHTLADRLMPYVEGDVVVIRVEWHDRVDAVQIAEVAKRRFLRARKEAELGEVNETVRLLSEKVEESRQRVEEATEQVTTFLHQKTGSEKKTKTVMKTVQVKKKGVTAPRKKSAVSVARKNELEKNLEETRSAIERLEVEYNRKREEAEATLAALRQSLGPAHPDFQAAVRTVEERSRPPQELGFLKREEAQFERELTRLKREAKSGSSSSQDLYETVQVPVSVQAAAEDSRVDLDDPETAAQFRELWSTVSSHNTLVERLAEARIEVDVAERAFQYRYRVTLPPLLPRKAVKPKKPLVLGGGFVLALIVAFFAAVGRDVWSRRVFEPWQVEVATGVPVLGLVPRSSDTDLQI